MRDKPTPPQNPSLEPLAPLVGEWDAEIRWSAATRALVGGPPAVRGASEFRWVDDGHFLVHHMRGESGPPQARWLIGRDDASGEYCALYSDARGVSRVYGMTFNGSVWRLWRDAPGFCQRFEATVKDNGRIEGRWETSTDGTRWEHDFDIAYASRQRA